jgi:magnesium chelatase subunit D
MTPAIALMTDGRANVALDGNPGRAAAEADALRLAKALRAAGIDALVIDTGNRPEPSLSRLAAEMGAAYLPLPRADAGRMKNAVAAALGA